MVEDTRAFQTVATREALVARAAGVAGGPVLSTIIAAGDQHHHTRLYTPSQAHMSHVGTSTEERDSA
jgi:hypothetical protein